MASFGRNAPLSGNAVVDGLMMGAGWTGPIVSYGFKPGDINENGVNDFDEGDWKAFHRELMSNVETFANLTFTEVSGTANINFRLDLGAGGESGVPVEGTLSVETAVGIDRNVSGGAEVVRLGTFSTTWFHELGHALGLKHTHETVPGLSGMLPGIEGPGDQGTTFLNSHLGTVMGYTWSFLPEDNPFTAAVDPGMSVKVQPGSFGAIDIAALQHLYGARSHNTDNTVYRFSDDVDANRGYTTIWDTGGFDTIAYTGTSRAKIDLRAATLENEIGGGGWISTSETLTGGVSIANGVVIESARGAAADDILIGNASANSLIGLAGNDVLRGDAGNDRLNGGAGDDILDGGEGRDSAVYQKAFASYALRLDGRETVVTGEGVDRLSDVETAIFSDGVYDLGLRVFTANPAPPVALNGTGGNDVLTATSAVNWSLDGGGGDDTLVGQAGNDRLNGGSGNDRLDGGAGADTMIGGVGDDTYIVDNIRDVVVEAQGNERNVIESSVSYTLGVGVKELVLTGSAAWMGTGNALDNVLTGNRVANVLNGGAGDDWLNGGLGRDKLIGGLGDDHYVIDNAGDVAIEGAGEGTDHIESTASFTLGDNVENLTLQGSGAIRGTGNDLSNIIIGSTAANVLTGLSGNDILVGAEGNDRLIGGAGIDTLTGGTGSDAFVFRDGETGSAAVTADRIADFEVGDRIDLTAFEAVSTFAFIGQAAFSGARGDVRFAQSDGVTSVEGDVDGDARADFLINLTGVHSLVATDFLL